MKGFRDQPIGRKVTLLILLASALALLLAAGGVVVYEATTVRPRVLRDLRSQADLLRANTAAALTFDDSQAAAENLRSLEARREVSAAALYQADGRLFARYLRFAPPADFEFPPEAPAVGSHGERGRIRLVSPVLEERELLGYLVLWYELPPLWARLPQYGIMVGVVLLALLTVSALLTWLLRTGLSGPLLGLAGTARAITERRDFTVRAVKYGDDEIGRLTDAFNAMLDAIEARDTALREHAEQLREALEAARMASWSYDAVVGTLAWGGAEIRLFGPGIPTDARLETFLAGLHPADREPFAAAIRAAVERGEPLELDVRRPAAGGRMCWFTLRGRRVEGPTGRRVVGLVQDVTERRSLEEQLLQSQKMEAIGRLAGGIAHDFNNLLTAILGYADFALRRVETEPAAAASDLQEIRRAGERAATLTQQLLAYGRRQMLQPAVLDLNDVVANLARLLGRLLGEHIRLVLELDPDAGTVLADRSSLEQVIVNLAVNARDAMATGGRLTVATAMVDLGEDRPEALRHLPPGRYARLTVSDTGHGMDPDTLEHVFEPFFTTKEVGKGTGLGLAMVYGTVSQSGGAVTASSAPGAGATFMVYLPQSARAPEAADPVGAPVLGGRETVLVVEDDPAVLGLAARALEAQGYDVKVAPTARAAWELLDGLDGADPPIDLLVTDVVMPDQSGRELADRLRARWAGLPVLYVSGYTDDAMVAHGVRDSAAAFLQKPFSAEVLARRVREVLDRAE